MTRVFLSMGSNLGDRLEFLRQGMERLLATPEVDFVGASPLYRTEPWERLPGQPTDEDDWFFNCVVAVDTMLEPSNLLARLQAIEGLLGRVRGSGSPEDQRYDRRPLDIDILLYGDRVISAADDLHIPHLLMHERGFVLRPLADLAPDLEHPTLYQTIGDLLAELQDDHRVLLSELPLRWWERWPAE